MHDWQHREIDGMINEISKNKKEIEQLKQQILDAENVIRELSFGELSDCIGNRKEVAETYWKKYEK